MRTERESDRRIREEKWHTYWRCRDQQIACRMVQASAEILEHTGLAEKDRVVSMPLRENSWQVRLSRPCQKEKEHSRQSRVPDHEGERVKVSESLTLARESEIRPKAWRGEGGQARRASLGEVEGIVSRAYCCVGASHELNTKLELESIRRFFLALPHAAFYSKRLTSRFSMAIFTLQSIPTCCRYRRNNFVTDLKRFHEGSRYRQKLSNLVQFQKDLRLEGFSSKTCEGNCASISY